jgi:hypothetical protein
VLGSLLWTVSSSIGCGEAAAAQPPSGNPTCSVVRSNRIYVDLAEGLHLDSFNTAAASAKDVLRVVQTGLCSTADSPALRQLLTPSLRRALDSRQRIVLEQVRFQDAALQHAHVLLRSSPAGHTAQAASATDLVWRARLRHEQVWRIANVRDEPAAISLR